MNYPIIYDGETNRPMTEEEFAQWQADAVEAEANAQAEAAKIAARIAVLNKLGLSAEEAAALLG